MRETAAEVPVASVVSTAPTRVASRESCPTSALLLKTRSACARAPTVALSTSPDSPRMRRRATATSAMPRTPVSTD